MQGVNQKNNICENIYYRKSVNLKILFMFYLTCVLACWSSQPVDGIIYRNIYDDYHISSEPISKENFYSDVYKAQSKKGKKIVAIKKFKMDRTNEKTILNEYEMSLLFNHENIIKAYEPLYKFPCEETNKIQLFMILEYCDGDRLTDFIRSKKNDEIPYKKVLEIMKSLLLGLNEMHRAGITHGDLMSNNVMFHNGVVKIIDLGYASSASNPKILYIKPEHRHICLHYAPECLEGNIYTTKADMFSFGFLMNSLKSMKIVFSNVEEWNSYCFDYNNLYARCMMNDPKVRISSDDALKHPLFNFDNLKEGASTYESRLEHRKEESTNEQEEDVITVSLSENNYIKILKNRRDQGYRYKVLIGGDDVEAFRVSGS